MAYISSFISLLFQVLLFAIFGRVIMSWIDPQGNMRVTQILNEITEPILGPIRSVLPSFGMFDLSPIVAILLLNLLRNLIAGAI